VENRDAVLRIPAQRIRLAEIRDFVASHARLAGAAPGKVDGLVQAVDELATNIIVHGYHDGPGEMEITFSKQEDAIVVVLRDRAPMFDTTQAPEPDIHRPLEERPIGGLGIHLARKCVDGLEHRRRAGGGNELIIEVRL
jgi:anti-sigma regulatory factor (Ser/Thr protein kinase)